MGSRPAEGPGALVGVCGALPWGLLEQSPSSLLKNPLQTHTRQGGAVLDRLPATSKPTCPGLSGVLQLREGPGVHVSVFQYGGRTRDPCRGRGQLGPGTFWTPSAPKHRGLG